MNTPAPATPDPTTPGTKAAPTALGAASTTALTGSPTALAFVWLLETYGTARGKPLKLDSTTAVLIGSVVASITGYLWQVASGLLAILQERLTRP